MTNTADDSRRFLRQAGYWLLIVVALGGILGRIAAVSSPDGKTVFLSANDRSRWCAIRALGDHGTHVIDDVIIKDPEGKTAREKFDKSWYSIDMVRHRGHDGQEHYYSSKPTLLNTILAGEYWLVKQVTGANLRENTLYVGRMMLIITNVLPLMLYFGLLARLIERYGTTDWGRLFTLACAAFGTLITTFAITLNNHVTAAVSVAIAIYAALPIWSGEERRLRYFIVAGCGAAFAATNELPALSFLALLGAGLLWKAPWQTLLGYVPPAAVVAAAALGTNYLAHGSWKTPYAHRHDGPVIAKLPANLAAEFEAGIVPNELRTRAAQQSLDLSPLTKVIEATPGERWVVWDFDGHDRLAIVRHGDKLEVREWDDWYEYDGSYWTPQRKQGVDRGEPSRLAYTFHVLVGHHGIFSLTPIWLLSAAGVVTLLSQRRHALFALAGLTAVLTLICLAFYITRPLEDRNYGGVSSGLRWMFWFTPLWLLCLLPIADAVSSRRSWRIVALLLLAVSIASANYALLNPWSHPWLYDYWEYLGWIGVD